MRKIAIASLVISALLAGHIGTTVYQAYHAYDAPVSTMEPASAERLLVQVGIERGEDWKEMVSKRMTDRDDWYLICDDNLYVNFGGQLKDVVAEADKYRCESWRVAVDADEAWLQARR